MSVYINGKYRIKRNANQQDAMIKLREAKIFEGYKDMLMISALIGYNNKKYIPIEKPAPDGVLMQFFDQKDYDIMDFIAYVHTGNQSIIRSDEKYEIFSAYANGGFPILLSKLEITDINNISDDESKQILLRYYKMLLSCDVLIDDVGEDELFV